MSDELERAEVEPASDEPITTPSAPRRLARILAMLRRPTGWPRYAWARLGIVALATAIVTSSLATILPTYLGASAPATPATPAALATATAAVATATPPVPPLDLTALVNPFIGTQEGQPDYGLGGSAGNTYPGATMPFGMVQLSPDTSPSGIAHPGGYTYTDGRIERFSLTHIEGAGCPIFGDVPFMPTTQTVSDSPAADPGRYSAPFAHRDELAAPGGYSVRLGGGVQVQLTATTRTGIARIQYPAGRPQVLLIESGADLLGVQQAKSQFVSATEVRGAVTGGPFCTFRPTTYTVYFDMQLSRPVSHFGAWDWGGVAPGARLAAGAGSGLYATLDARGGTQLVVKVGLSYISTANAAANLAAEAPGWDFDGARAAADAAWNSLLNRVQAAGGSNSDERTFYTAMYHSLLAPNTFSDANGQYIGFDHHVHTTVSGHTQYANFSAWDIYRSEVPLLALLAPGQTSDMMQSLVNDGEQQGALPRWPLANGDTGIMVGDPPVAILAEGVAYGATDFDMAAALRLALAGATRPDVQVGGLPERAGLGAYLNLGYVPVGSAYAPASASLEYYSEDYAIACLARALNDDADARRFAARAAQWGRLYNPATGYIQPRSADGAFYGSGDPASDDQFIEGNASQYTWMVPFDMGGLVRKLGGAAQAQHRLDVFFSRFAWSPFSPYAWMGNEPSFGAPWAYDYMGAPWKTQATVRRVMTHVYADAAGGLPGNDDSGTMSSWYVWAALGMYPLVPGRAGFVLGSPLFPDVTLTLGSDHIRILAAGAARTAPYVQGLELDGLAYSRLWLPLTTLSQASELDYILGATPNMTWGAMAADAPPSLSTERWPAYPAPPPHTGPQPRES